MFTITYIFKQNTDLKLFEVNKVLVLSYQKFVRTEGVDEMKRLVLLDKDPNLFESLFLHVYEYFCLEIVLISSVLHHGRQSNNRTITHPPLPSSPT